MKNIAVFDIDGTILKGNEVAIPAFSKIAKEMGLKVTEKEIKGMMGEKQSAIEKKLGISDPVLAKKVFERINALEIEFIYELKCVYEGLVDCINKLYDEGVIIAVASMATAAYINAVLEVTGLKDKVSFIRHDEEGKTKSHLVSEILKESGAERAVMVGDRKFDKKAAEDCGIPFVACLYGGAPDEVIDSKIVAKTGLDVYEKIKIALNLK